MIAKSLWQLGGIIITFLAAIHLYYTFYTQKFSSRNKTMIEAMKTSYPTLTNKTTMWKAWTGFNASHSAGAMFIGIINIYLANRYFETLQSDDFFFVFNIITICFYVGLAIKYWFRIPLIGLVLTLCCFLLSYFLTIVNR